MKELGRQRVHYWDNIKGILIFLVVFTHILYPFLETNRLMKLCVDTIYSFHMPAFVFVSGYFGKKRFSIESIAKLLYLYFCFNTFYGFIIGFGDSFFIPVKSYWYILALIVWRLITPFIGERKHILAISFIIAIIAGCYSMIDGTFAISRIIALFPFYLLGYKFTVKQSTNLIKKDYRKRFFVGFALAIVACVILFVLFQVYYVPKYVFLMSPYQNYNEIIIRIIIFIVALMFCAVLCCCSINKRIPCLTLIGRYSIWIYLFHRPITQIISSFLENYEINPIIIMALAVPLSFVICIMFGNKYIAKPLDTFAKTGGELILNKCEKRFSFARIVLIIAFCCLLSLIFIDPQYGVLGKFL